MTRSAPAPSAPLQTGRAYAGRAGSIMRFSGDDTAKGAAAMSHSKTTSGARGFGAARWGTQVRLGAVGGVRRAEGEKGCGGRGGSSEQRGREELMKRGFVLLWAALGFSREFSHVAANSANVGSFIFLHSEQRLNINHPPPPPKKGGL